MNFNNQSDELLIDDNPFIMSNFERTIKFYVLIIFQIPSFFCTIFMLYHFEWHRLHSQIYGFLIIINGLIVIVELPITLLFLHEGALRTNSICSPWIVINYSLFYFSITLMAWTSVERYLFIYNERVITRHYILLHYLPICLILFYGTLFYLSTIVWHTCQPDYDIHRYVCGGACYQYELILGLFDWIANVLITTFITFFVNIIIIIRHFVQKHRMKRVVVAFNRNHQWRRSAKLTTQLVAVSMLYIVGWIPYTTIGLIQDFANTQQLAYLLSSIFVFIPYIQTSFLPIICLLFTPKIMQKLRTLVMESYFVKMLQDRNQVHII